MKFPNLDQRLRLALEEDGAFQDVTTRFLPDLSGSRSRARFEAKADGVFCGGSIIARVFRQLDPRARVQILKKDGQFVRKGTILARVYGRSGALFSGERVALNLIGRMSGVATHTRRFRDALKNLPVSILDTRKTTPLWRDLERYAVTSGGGANHRFNLADAILVKDNHIAYLDQKKKPVSRVYSSEALKAMRKRLKFVAIEATNTKQVWEAIKARADIILLDNMAENQIKGAMVFIRAARKALNLKTPLAEISGGIRLANIQKFAKLGIDRISIGALTHSAPALDISMEVE